MKRFVGLMLAVIMLTATLPRFAPDTAYAFESKDYNGLKVAYIPIDNRPVNYDRVKMLAKSVGFELLMPEEDTF